MSPLYPDNNNNNSPFSAKGSPLTTPRQRRTLGQRRRLHPTATSTAESPPQHNVGLLSLHDAIRSRHSDNHGVLPPLPFALSESSTADRIMTTPRPTTHDDSTTNQFRFSPHRSSSILDIIDQALTILQDDDTMDTTDSDENQHRPQSQR